MDAKGFSVPLFPPNLRSIAEIAKERSQFRCDCCLHLVRMLLTAPKPNAWFLMFQVVILSLIRLLLKRLKNKQQQKWKRN